MKRIKSIQIAIFFTCLLIATSCVEEFKQVPLPSGSTITQIVSGSTDFNILSVTLTKTGLASTFNNNNSGAFTVFAPTDVAFVAYFNSLGGAFATLDEAGVLNWINTTLSVTSTPSLATLTGILLYHSVSSEIASAKITGGTGFVTMGGTARLSASKSGAAIVLNANKAGQNAAGNGGQTVTLDIDASNGIIHSINKVLIPVSLANIWIGTSPAVTPVVDLPGFNVDYSTSPPAITVFSVTMPRKIDGTLNIATAAVGALNNYNLISASIARAELAPIIRPIATPFPDFTLFAPTDAAFQTYLATLPGGTVVTSEATARDFINIIAPATLANIVNYHLVKGRIVSTDLADGQVVTTQLTGKTFKVNRSTSFTLTDGKNGVSTVTSADNLTNAGVLHQINKVLEFN